MRLKEREARAFVQWPGQATRDAAVDVVRANVSVFVLEVETRRGSNDVCIIVKRQSADGRVGHEAKILLDYEIPVVVGN